LLQNQKVGAILPGDDDDSKGMAHFITEYQRVLVRNGQHH
jgi:hypothetical protein